MAFHPEGMRPDSHVIWGIAKKIGVLGEQISIIEACGYAIGISNRMDPSTEARTLSPSFWSANAGRTDSGKPTGVWIPP